MTSASQSGLGADLPRNLESTVCWFFSPPSIAQPHIYSPPQRFPGCHGVLSDRWRGICPRETVSRCCDARRPHNLGQQISRGEAPPTNNGRQWQTG